MDIEQVENPVIETKVSTPILDQEHAKINSLTGLRFIAACLVFMFYTPVSPYLPAFVRSFISSGNNGATLFFVLSGFVLCYNYYDAFSKRFAPTLKPFFVARFTRIYPLHVFLFLLFFTARSRLALPQHLGPILAQLTLTQAWSSNIYVVFSYNAPAWIFSVAAFLYLCFPLLALLLLKRATKTWHLCLIGFVAFSAIFLWATWFGISHLILIPTHNLSGVHHQLQAWVAISHLPLILSSYWVSEFPVARLGDFILGCAAARIYVLQMSKPVSRREQTLGVTLLLLSIAAVIVLMGSSNPFLTPYKLDAGYSLFFVVIMYALARYASPLSRFLSTKLLVLLGEASYAFFLLQYMFLIHGLSVVSISAVFGGDLYTVMQFLLIVVAALGVHTYFEKPLRKRIRQFFLRDARQDSQPLQRPTT